ncbi:type VI secretion system tube protein TssD [Aquimarina sediminis]|uniref:type VI secretion system tube protein TssD n=1 Tax=Aquimarina sediminis TaxID=2070536 RepID=UPI000CA04A67|nr:type VI secretion system tube protein TssD [Aquimarina sediminis]
MSFLAKLNIDGEEFNILECDFGLKQNADETGRPSAKPKGGQIRLLIESNVKLDFFEWAASGSATKNGGIVFYRRDNVSSLKKLEFRDTYCLEYRELFNAVDDKPLRIYLTLSAKELVMRGTTFTNNWPMKV